MRGKPPSEYVAKMKPEAIAAAFLDACRTEIVALKPGNVHIYAPGHRMTAADFKVSAAAAAPFIAAQHLIIGERILAAVKATWNAVGQNTNLGIVLLAVPLAAARLNIASLKVPSPEKLRESLGGVLSALTTADAEAAFEAIRLANPGGLGEEDTADVRHRPTVTLLEGMRLASHRDRIAYQYASVYEDIFGLGLSSLKEGLRRFGDKASAATYCYMSFLASFPDTHITRKHDLGTARAVQQQAIPLLARLDAAETVGSLKDDLLAFDAELKRHSLNPGTSADLTVATLFAFSLLSA